VIAKLPSPDPTSRLTGVTLRNYEREVRFYTDIAPTVDIRVAACYHAQLDDVTGDFVLLLEDLAPCEQGNQITGCDEDHARRAVRELARLHGPRWGDPALHDVEWLQRRTDDDADRLAMLWAMFVPGFLATYGTYLDQAQRAVVDRFGARLPSWVAASGAPTCVTHGDYRLDNLMFASPAGGYPVAAVDWQTPGHGPAAGDLAYFLGAGPLPDVRRSIERDLLDEYRGDLAGYGVAVGREELWQDYRRMAYGGVIMSVVASQIVGASDRSEAMFAAMAVRHTQHVIDVGAEELLA
jgi:aminoglycoside/choline kinase family phosphotransferase